MKEMDGYTNVLDTRENLLYHQWSENPSFQYGYWSLVLLKTIRIQIWKMLSTILLLQLFILWDEVSSNLFRNRIQSFDIHSSSWLLPTHWLLLIDPYLEFWSFQMHKYSSKTEDAGWGGSNSTSTSRLRVNGAAQVGSCNRLIFVKRAV